MNKDSDGGTGSTGGWDIVESAGAQPGAFTNTVSDLDIGSTYYARVYVTNEVGMAWSTVISFMTKASPPQLTLNADNQIDGSDPELVFDEAPGLPMEPDGSQPNWTYDFSDYGTNAIPVILSTNMLYAGSTANRGKVTLDMNGGSLSGERSAGSLAVRTHENQPNSNNENAHDLVIADVGNISLGGIDASGHTYRGGYYSGSSAYAGDIEIGSADNRAGAVEVGYIYARRYDTGSSDAGGEGSPGNVTIYSDSNVSVVDSGGNRGDILAYTLPRNGGTITIDHFGDLVARDIDNYSYGRKSANSRGGDITLNGGDASGTLEIRDIDASMLDGSYGGGAKHSINIRNYSEVTINDIIATGFSENGGASTRHAANVVIEDIAGDVNVEGAVDLYADGNSTYTGHLKITCTGSVTLAELDVNRMNYAALDSGSGASKITGVITNFDATVSSGSGTVDDPYVSDETRLRAPAGQRIYYEYVSGAINNSLGGHVWQLPNPNNDGDGGLLVVAPLSGPIIFVR